jgi:hypothetical protein
VGGGAPRLGQATLAAGARLRTHHGRRRNWRGDRDGNSGTGTGYPPSTRPDGDGHGYHFSPVGGAHTRPDVRRVRGGDLILPMGNPWVPVKQSQTQQNISVSAQHSAQPNIPHPTGAA